MRYSRKQFWLMMAAVWLILHYTDQPQHASALECRHPASAAADVKLGSQVDGNFVTICLSKVAVASVVSGTTATKVVKPRVTNPKPATLALAKPKPRLHTRSIGVRFGGNGSFTPVIAQPTVWPASTGVNRPVALKTNQPERYGFGHILGRSVSVRFTPMALHWQLSDGSHAASATSKWTLGHSFAKPGSYTALLRVTYRVRFRLGTGAWQSERDQITLPASPLRILVDQAAPSRVVLVKNR